jgi:MFS family permease
MNRARHFLSSILALGKERIWLLGVLTAGHFVIHWFQQFYPVILPALKSGLNLTNVEVGALTSAQQVVVGLGQLPSGMVADALGARVLSLPFSDACDPLLTSPQAWPALFARLQAHRLPLHLRCLDEPAPDADQPDAV